MINLLAFTGVLLCSSLYGLSQWSFLGLSGRRVEALRLDGQFLYASTDDGIYQRSVHAPDTVWTPLGFQGQRAKGLLIINPDTMFANVRITGVEGDTISLFRTTTGGVNWIPFQNGFGGGTMYNQVLALDGLPDQFNVLFATGQAVVAKSMDGGLTWRNVWGEWDWGGMGTHFVKIDRSLPNTVWAGGEAGFFQPYILKSTDSGENWQEMWIDAGGDNACYVVAIDPSNSDVVYVGMEGRIIKTTNGGMDWHIILAPEDYPYFFGVAISSLVPSHIYAAGLLNTPDPQDLVLYKSEDGGTSWTSLIQGDSGKKGVVDLLIVSSDNSDRLYFATWGDGVYQYVETIATTEEKKENRLPTSFLLAQNYPNPFNPSTILRYDLPRAGHVSLIIYDLLGREVAQLVSGRMVSGRYEVVWDATDVPTGIYFVRMSSGSFSQVRKVMVLK